MNNTARSLFVIGILAMASFAFSMSAEGAGFIYDFNSRTIQGSDVPRTDSEELGAFDYSITASGSAGSLSVSQHSILDATVMSGTFTSLVHAVTVNCESVENNDLLINFKVAEDTPFRFSGTTTHRLQRTGNPLEDFCGGPVGYLFGMSNGAPYIQTFIDFPFDATATGTVTNSFDVSGVFRSNATHTLYIALPVGAKLGAGGTGSVDSTRTLNFTLALPQPPLLSVTRSASNVAIKWPASAANYVLESALSLTPPATWSTVTNSVTTANGTNTVNIQAAETNRFFRLRKTGQ